MRERLQNQALDPRRHTKVHEAEKNKGSQPPAWRDLRLLDTERGWIWPLLIGLAAFVLYASTTAPSIAFLYDDSLEFQLVAPTFGIAHPTGYPLYTLLGGAWTHLIPTGNWAWRLNLFSAVTGAATVALLCALTRRISGSLWAGILAAAAFSLSPLWWQQTTLAEVYALHGLFVAALLYAAVRFADDQTPIAHRMPILLGLVGLSLTHHRTSVLILPGLALFLLWKEPSLLRPQPRWIGWIAALLTPLLLYAYLPLRAAAGISDLEGDYANTWTGFWDHVLARLYSSFFADNLLAVTRSAGDWLAFFVAQVGWIGLILAALGMVAALRTRQRWPAWTLIAVTGIVNLGFAVNYRVGDAEVFALPAVLCLSIFIGNVIVLPSSLLTSRWVRLLVGGAATGMILLFPIHRGPVVDRAGDWAVHDYAVAMAKVDFPPNSQVVGLRGQMTALAYMQAAEQLGLSATPVAIDDAEERRDHVASAVTSAIPLFLTQELDGIGNQYSFSGEGPLVRVWPRGQAETGSPSIRTEAEMADGALRLLGYDRHVAELAGGPALQIVLYWQPQAALDQRYKLSFRLLDGDGAQLAQEDRFPLRQVASTADWLPTEAVRDVHDLPLPADATQLLVIVYDEETLAEAGRVEIPLQ
ncbi:DUF2723 domain-containing protein [bacterium]|nr:DUF2723 domain-containing protein [bacterium]